MDEERGWKGMHFNRLPHLLSELEVGRYLLLPEPWTFANVRTAIRKLEKRKQGVWSLETCNGHTTNMGSLPFKFLKVTREK